MLFRKEENSNKRKLSTTGKKKGDRRGNCNKLFFAWILEIIFDRSKAYNILSVCSGNNKDDYIIKKREQSDFGVVKISTFHVNDKVLMPLDCDKLCMYSVIFKTITKKFLNNRSNGILTNWKYFLWP